VVQPEEAWLLESIGAAAQELPRSVIEELCDELAGMSEDFSSGQRASLPAIVASPGARVRVFGLIEAWNSAPDVSPACLAWALRGLRRGRTQPQGADRRACLDRPVTRSHRAEANGPSPSRSHPHHPPHPPHRHFRCLQDPGSKRGYARGGQARGRDLSDLRDARI
jgi:hypothetical protein